jgi:hypothetical protein
VRAIDIQSGETAQGAFRINHINIGGDLGTMESIFEYMQIYDFENLFFCQDKALDFKAIIAIHDTTLGPATGGCRMWHTRHDIQIRRCRGESGRGQGGDYWRSETDGP